VELQSIDTLGTVVRILYLSLEAHVAIGLGSDGRGTGRVPLVSPVACRFAIAESNDLCVAITSQLRAATRTTLLLLLWGRPSAQPSPHLQRSPFCRYDVLAAAIGDRLDQFSCLCAKPGLRFQCRPCLCVCPEPVLAHDRFPYENGAT
jgi:hypothetical protein